MKHLKKSVLLFSSLLFLHCADDDDNTVDLPTVNTTVNFTYKTTITVGGEAAAEISAYDKITKKLFVTNAESNEISIYNLLDLESPIQEPAISLSAFGSPNAPQILEFLSLNV